MLPLRFALGILALLALAPFAIGFALPSAYRVERSIYIEAPPERIYRLVAAPRRWTLWSIWARRDPAMAIEYFGPETGAGAGCRWTSRTEGRGEMRLVEADPARGLRYTLYSPNFDSTSSGEIFLLPEGRGTRVIWTDAGDMGRNPLRHYVAAAMNRLVGPDFLAGLRNLKALAEKP